MRVVFFIGSVSGQWAKGVIAVRGAWLKKTCRQLEMFEVTGLWAMLVSFVGREPRNRLTPRTPFTGRCNWRQTEIEFESLSMGRPTDKTSKQFHDLLPLETFVCKSSSLLFQVNRTKPISSFPCQTFVFQNRIGKQLLPIEKLFYVKTFFFIWNVPS